MARYSTNYERRRCEKSCLRHDNCDDPCKRCGQLRGQTRWLECMTDGCRNWGKIECDRCHASACTLCSHMWMAYCPEEHDWAIVCLRCATPTMWKEARPNYDWDLATALNEGVAANNFSEVLGALGRLFHKDECSRHETLEEARKAQEARARLCVGC